MTRVLTNRVVQTSFLPESIMDDNGAIPIGTVCYVRGIIEGYARDVDGIRCGVLVPCDRKGHPLTGERCYWVPESMLVPSRIVAEDEK